MRPYILLAIIGVIVATLAALAVRNTVPDTAETAQAQVVNTVGVLVAKENISAGKTIQTDKHLIWSEWPEDKLASLPYITEKDGDLAQFNGAVARRHIHAGEPIAAGALIQSGGGLLSAVLAEGKRAVSIPADTTTGNAGFILPGDHVDLILTYSVQQRAGERFLSGTFVENVRVLAVDQSIDNPENAAILAKTVTVEVSPKEAETIAVALQMGRISLALRRIGDTSSRLTQARHPSPPPAQVEGAQTGDAKDLEYFYPSQDEGSTDADNNKLGRLLSGQQVAPNSVRVIRGDESTDVQFDQLTP